MRFTYEGEETSTLGYTFKDGQPTEVTDPMLIKKLQGNSAFHQVNPGEETEVEKENREHDENVKSEALAEMEVYFNDKISEIRNGAGAEIEELKEQLTISEGHLKNETERADKAEKALATLKAKQAKA